MYMVLVFGLLFYVKNDWCDLLFKNFTVGAVFEIVTFKNFIFKVVIIKIVIFKIEMDNEFPV